jgi:hypothetical protein
MTNFDSTEVTLESMFANTAHPRADDFDNFYQERKQRLIHRIEGAMGRIISSLPDEAHNDVTSAAFEEA